MITTRIIIIINCYWGHYWTMEFMKGNYKGNFILSQTGTVSNCKVNWQKDCFSQQVSLYWGCRVGSLPWLDDQEYCRLQDCLVKQNFICYNKFSLFILRALLLLLPFPWAIRRGGWHEEGSVRRTMPMKWVVFRYLKEERDNILWILNVNFSIIIEYQIVYLLVQI